MKKILIFSAFFCFTCAALFAQSGWIAQNSGVPSASKFHAVQFVDANTGYAIAEGPYVNNTDFYGYFLKTINGGNTWTHDSSMGEVFWSMHFFDANTGIIGEWDLRRTTDGGATWTEYDYYSTGGPATKLLFLDNNTGYAFGPIFISKTVNGGTSWTSVRRSNVGGLYDAAFMKNNYAFSCGYTPWYSTNAGASWFNNPGSVSNNWTPAPTPLSRMWYISKLDSNNVMACGDSGIVKSSDGGVNWINVYPYVTGNPAFRSMKYFNLNEAMAVGDEGLIVYTNDGGATWTEQESGVTTSLNKIFFISSTTGWVVGDNGVILKTTTKGSSTLTGVTPLNTGIADKFSLSQNYPNPFNPSTVIKWQVAQTGFVSVVVYDALGNEVKTLVNENQSPGSYSVEFNAASLPSGIYFYKMITENFSDTRKMILVK